MPPAAPRFVFLDTEATGLDHSRHELTEVAWIVRFPDGSQLERQYYPEHTTDGATEEALEITRYAERIAPQTRTPAREWLTQFLEDARGAFLVGAVPDFDATHLERMCRKMDLEPTWDHHLVDVETLALPLISPGPDGPRSLARTCEALGVDHDSDQAHGALYDARQAMRVFDRVWELMAAIRTGETPLPAAVPRPPRNGNRNGNGDGNGNGNGDGNGDEAVPATTPPGQSGDAASGTVATGT
jgi:DNA polymerase III epsilon subunit-like protein